MWCNQNEYNEQRGTTKDWLFPFVRLEAIVSGVSVISEALGHHSETTTQIYLNSIKSSEVDDANAQILAAL